MDFKNTVIIMTSNLGSALDPESTRKDEDESPGEIEEELQRQFRPEFLNRIDDVIVFHRLTREEIEQIVEDPASGSLAKTDGRPGDPIDLDRQGREAAAGGGPRLRPELRRTPPQAAD